MTEGKEAALVSLPCIFAFKVGMTQVVNDKGDMVACTVLRYEPWYVSQIKMGERDGYSAVQLACLEKRDSNSSSSEKGHFKKAGMKSGYKLCTEVRTEKVDGFKLGSPVSIESLKKGDVIKVSARSKGKGFAGSVKRWNAGGGPAAHGSCFHRQPGSSGNRTWPGRIMKGKAFPGHLGDEMTTVKNLSVLDVYKDDNIVLVSGSIPGSRNSLVKVEKQ